jgi:hypothetical protein
MVVVLSTFSTHAIYARLVAAGIVVCDCQRLATMRENSHGRTVAIVNTASVTLALHWARLIRSLFLYKKLVSLGAKA